MPAGEVHADIWVRLHFIDEIISALMGCLDADEIRDFNIMTFSVKVRCGSWLFPLFSSLEVYRLLPDVPPVLFLPSVDVCPSYLPPSELSSQPEHHRLWLAAPSTFSAPVFASILWGRWDTLSWPHFHASQGSFSFSLRFEIYFISWWREAGQFQHNVFSSWWLLTLGGAEGDGCHRSAGLLSATGRHVALTFGAVNAVTQWKNRKEGNGWFQQEVDEVILKEEQEVQTRTIYPCSCDVFLFLLN